MHMGLRCGDVLDHPRQHLAAVDEELDTVAFARRERTPVRPAAWGRSRRVMTAAREPAAVVRRDSTLDGVAEGAVDPVERERRHPDGVVSGGGAGVVVGGGGGEGCGAGGGAGGFCGVCSVTGGGELLCGAEVVVVVGAVDVGT